MVHASCGHSAHDSPQPGSGCLDSVVSATSSLLSLAYASLPSSPGSYRARNLPCLGNCIHTSLQPDRISIICFTSTDASRRQSGWPTSWLRESRPQPTLRTRLARSRQSCSYSCTISMTCVTAWLHIFQFHVLPDLHSHHLLVSK